MRPIIDASRIATSRIVKRSAARRSFSLMVPSPPTSPPSVAAPQQRPMPLSPLRGVVYVHLNTYRVYEARDTVSMERVCESGYQFRGRLRPAPLDFMETGTVTRAEVPSYTMR